MEKFYHDAEELLPPNMPKTRVCSGNIRTYVDVDHVGNVSTWRSHTGIFVLEQLVDNLVLK